MKTLGKFGKYGGMFVSETLVPALEELEGAYSRFKKDAKAQAELQFLLREYAGRPTLLYHAKNLSEMLGCKIYLKREDLLHGGAHKTNNGLGQGLLAKYMGKKRIIAETGAGQHGFTDILENEQVKISMDSRGRYLDNIFTERLWRTVKYENIYLKHYQNIKEARDGLTEYFDFYNNKRFHSSLNNLTPSQVYFESRSRVGQPILIPHQLHLSNQISVSWQTSPP